MEERCEEKMNAYVQCELRAGHLGLHRNANADAEWDHEPCDVESWEQEQTRASRDAARLTLAAAALTGILAADKDRVIGFDQAAHEAVKHGDATLAALWPEEGK